jgi:hypothetical protein
MIYSDSLAVPRWLRLSFCSRFTVDRQRAGFRLIGTTRRQDARRAASRAGRISS